ncbi:MAG: TlpA family protein disulfide reductase [Gammaproteobacteria bacterium]|nr:TlpA family protein disulfide reductase [Gammaproteobacteria bacterium]
MNQKVALGAVALMLVAGIGGWYFGKVSEEERYRVETPDDVTRVEFALSDMDGAIRNSSEWHGKARLINFWATWCAPCRREIPLLKKTQEAHAADNVQIIGIAVDFPDEVSVYAEEAQFNYPILVGQEDAMAVAEDSGIEFIGLPFTMIVAPSGELIKAHVGEIFESHIEQILAVFKDLENREIDIDGAREALGDF